MNINAHTRLYGIFGNPVRHSLSPAMHNAGFAAAGINAVYTAFQVSDIAKAVQAMRTLDIRGASVTIPFKQAVMSCIDAVDPLAAEIGAVNTLVNTDGTITGYNTDGIGAQRALEASGIGITGSRVLVLGNGGSARAIACTLLHAGAAITIAGRDRGRIQSLADDLRRHGEIAAILIADLSPAIMSGIDIIINTTSVGMQPQHEQSPIEGGLILPAHTVFDIVYAPRQTRLLDLAQAAGAAIVHGSDMLLYQGARQFELWTGQAAPVEVMNHALERALYE